MLGWTRQCLRSLYAVSNSSVFRARRKLLKDSADYSCTTVSPDRWGIDTEADDDV